MTARRAIRPSQPPRRKPHEAVLKVARALARLHARRDHAAAVAKIANKSS